MHSNEAGVHKNSNYHLFTASMQARKVFFYPTYIGYFYYEPNYYLHRDSYDSFLIMHVKKGSCYIKVNNHTQHVEKNQIVFIDCYKPHTYYTHTGWEAEWIHFDGPIAREYFNMITTIAGNVITLRDTYIFEKYLHKIYLMFHENKPIKEALVSQYITNILTELLISQERATVKSKNSNIVDETIAYINEHLCDKLTLDILSERVFLSPYYFTRMFKRETGFTPHEYIIASRINSAKFLLKNTNLPVKEICFNTGFTSESAFCSTFKKWEKCTPSAYRNDTHQE